MTLDRKRTEKISVRHIRACQAGARFVAVSLAIAGSVLFATSCAEKEEPKNTNAAPAASSEPVGKEITTASGLKYVDLVIGTGPSPKTGQIVAAHYTGTLTDGKKFDSSRDRGQPYPFRIGMGNVIAGWDEGLMTMKVGGRRKLIVPPSLGYGATGSPPVIPPNATLLFDIELVSVK